MSSFGFYKKVVALNSEVHRNLKIAAEKGNFSYAKDANAVMLTGMEFTDVSREYPIVFVRADDGTLRPIALLGIRDGENLFVDENGKWDARYIPAYIRRYPFVMAPGGPNGMVVCMDEACPALGMEHGESIFDAEGKPTPRMNDMIQFLQQFQQEHARTDWLTKQLDELGIFVPQEANFDTGNGETFALKDFYLIDEAKFGALPEEKILQLFKNGGMGLVYLHLASLGNLAKLTERLAARNADQKKAAAEAVTQAPASLH
jgi:hypothetical protein